LGLDRIYAAVKKPRLRENLWREIR
jgi:hypothetical protein